MLKYSRNTAKTGIQKRRQHTVENITLDDGASALLPKQYYVNDRTDDASNPINMFVMDSNAIEAQQSTFD